MPSYADLGGYGPDVTSPINAAYYTDGCGGSAYPASSTSTPIGTKTAWSRTQAAADPVVAKLSFDDIPLASTAKYHSLANRETTVRLSALPAKLQPMFATFDVRGDGLLDTAELGKAADLYRRHQAAKKYKWLRMVLQVIIILCIGYLALMSCFQAHPCPEGSSLGPREVTLGGTPAHGLLGNETVPDLLQSAASTAAAKP